MILMIMQLSGPSLTESSIGLVLAAGSHSYCVAAKTVRQVAEWKLPESVYVGYCLFFF
jgi:hypothetical protein